jgi:hypothetical protein
MRDGVTRIQAFRIFQNLISFLKGGHCPPYIGYNRWAKAGIFFLEISLALGGFREVDLH